MTGTTRPARANCKGDLCPAWCVVDHETPGHGRLYEFHGGQIARIEVPGALAGVPDLICVRPVSDGQPGSGEPHVSVSGTVYGSDLAGPNAWVRPRDAEDIARLAEMLAGATPGRHRELAAQIRAAAAVITEDGPADPEPEDDDD
jgi:hypothetical protein